MTVDLKDHFLASPMHQPKFMKIPTARCNFKIEP